MHPKNSKVVQGHADNTEQLNQAMAGQEIVYVNLSADTSMSRGEYRGGHGRSKGENTLRR
jgi:hypothetical protein